MGSVREGRMNARVADWVESEAKKKFGESALIEVVDLEDYNLSGIRQPIHFMADSSLAPADLKKAEAKVKELDCFIFVTPEYNLNIPPALKKFIDLLPPPIWWWKSAAIISYSMGRFGGNIVPHSLRQTFCEIGLIPVTKPMSIPFVHEEIDENGALVGQGAESFQAEIEKTLDVFEFYATAIKEKRENGPVPKNM